jgi:tetratricopeptide (TPR) repeat protein
MYDQSLKYYCKANDLINVYNIEAEEYTHYNILRGIGVVYSFLGNNEMSINYYDKALTESEIKWTKQSRNYISALTDLGEQYIYYGEYETAMSLIESARQLAIKHIDLNSFVYADILDNLGSIYTEKGKFEEALEYSINAKEIYDANEIINEKCLGKYWTYSKGLD